MSGVAPARSDAAIAAILFAIDPFGTGGICVCSGAGPARDSWLDALRCMLPAEMAFRKLPLSIPDGRLLGGIDLAATLQTGCPVAERGLLAEMDGGVLLVAMAERLASSTAAHLNAALDAHEIVVERDGLSLRIPSSFGVVAFDEGIDDEAAPASLCDRLAFCIDLNGANPADFRNGGCFPLHIIEARARLTDVVIGQGVIETLVSVAASLGVSSLRAPLLAVRVARAAAALDGERELSPDHIELAARLVLAPRAKVLLAPPSESQQGERPESRDEQESQPQGRPLDDVVLEAAQAAIPADLLKRLQDDVDRRRTVSSGKHGVAKAGPKRGRPIGARRGELRAGARLNVLETLRAAAPWQKLRRTAAGHGQDASRLLIRKDDFRVTRFKQRCETATIFVVDASGSSALQRLAEVKGAVELMLADCYVRRDQVALIAFRGRGAELLLPPTRSLTRAKRSLAALPGGGGTPLSAAIASATALALAVRNKGQTPTIVLMTDGRANISRDGRSGRTAAEADALDAARQVRASGLFAIVVDTSPRPQPQAEKLAAEMRARYVALPFADATRLSRAVKDQVGGS
jgi:magnesium chelatase subunit D